LQNLLICEVCEATSALEGVTIPANVSEVSNLKEVLDGSDMAKGTPLYGDKAS
jgi:hypothetical protein